MEIIINTVYFESDAEFEDFCIAPFVSKKQDATFVPNGNYSDLYKQYLAEGKKFIIMDEDSVIYKHMGRVTKRVPVMMEGKPTGKTALVQLRAENLEHWFYMMLSPEDLSPEERNDISKLINDKSLTTYQQIAESLDIGEEEAFRIFKWWQKEGIIK